MVPRIAVQLPLPLPIPDGFDLSRLETWPLVTGRLEFVAGRLEYMPPSGEIQQRVVVDVLTELNLWSRQRVGFVVGNEAGMLLGGEVRAADAAVWPRGPATEGFARTPPLLAVEVCGADDTVDGLRLKAQWYVGRGVPTVWIVDASARSVTVVTGDGARTVSQNENMPEPAGLADLSPSVASFFRQLS